MARRPLTDEQLRAKVAAYCQRYGVTQGPEGLPPFPSGHRETPQHREWLTVYRALQRHAIRAAAEAAPAAASANSLSCPICHGALEHDLSVPYARRAAMSSRPARLHPACAELARLAESLGPDAVAGLQPFLWPRRTKASRSR
jgi:hypothetical protein